MDFPEAAPPRTKVIFDKFFCTISDPIQRAPRKNDTIAADQAAAQTAKQGLRHGI